MITKQDLRSTINREMPSIPLNKQEELVSQCWALYLSCPKFEGLRQLTVWSMIAKAQEEVLCEAI